jgi:hypothetical protein
VTNGKNRGRKILIWQFFEKKLAIPGGLEPPTC